MHNNKKKKILLIAAGLCLLGLCVWWLVRSGYETTDNAYVHGDITAIAPKVSGHVTSIAVHDNTAVQAGDELFRIDDTDFAADLAQADAAVAISRANLANLEASLALQEAKIQQTAAQLEGTTAALLRAEKERDRQTRLRKATATTEQTFENALTSHEQALSAHTAAQAALEVEKRRIAVLTAQKDGAKASLAQAQAKRRIAVNNLEHTIVRAPVDGIVGNRRVRVGRYVTLGTPVIDIVPVSTVWLVANMKEVQLEHIREGQPATISIDAYPGISLHGTVESLAPGSGAAFSMLPPDNATGNFIRIVQRVPIKIVFTDNPLGARLVPGLSAQVSIKTRK